MARSPIGLTNLLPAAPSLASRQMTFTTHRVLFAMSLLLLVQSPTLFGQELDNDAPASAVLMLSDDSVASQLKLIAEVQQQIEALLQERIREPQRREEIDQQILQLLSAEQRTQLEHLTSEPRLFFNYREAKWIDVLNWFAKQSGLSLLVNNPPPDSFTYSDSRSYTPREAIDLLNGVLVTKGYTLIKKDRLLVCIRVADGIPDGLVPETSVDELSEFGSFDLVKITFPLESKPVDTVTAEIKPLLGTFGDSLLLPQSKRLIVTSTAGNMRAIAAAIDSIKAPPKPEPKPKPPAKEQPKPQLVTYDASPGKAAVAAELIKKILGESANFTIDEEANKITAYSVPSQHVLIQKVLTQIKENSNSDKKPFLEIYPFAGDGFATLAEQASLAAKKASIHHDEANRRILVFANDSDQKVVAGLMEKLSGRTLETSDRAENVEVYTIDHANVASVADAFQVLFPSARISTEPQLNKLIVRASEPDRQQIRQLVDRLDLKPDRQTSPRFIDLEKKFSNDQSDAIKAVAPDAEIRVQRQGRRLMIVANMEDHLAIETLLQQFNAAEDDPQKQLQVYTVDDTLKKQFLNVRTKLDPTLDEIEIVDQSRRDRLVILATPAAHVSVTKVLERLKTIAADDAKRRIEVYAVADPLKKHFVDLHRKIEPKLESIEIIGADKSGQLAILATESQHENISTLLDELKLKMAPQLRVLKTYDVTEEILRQFANMRRTLAPELQSISIADTGHKDKLTVVASADQQKAVESLLQDLAAQFPAQPKQELKLYSVSAAVKRQFIAALPILKESIDDDVTVIASDQENELLLSATAESHRQIAASIEKLAAQAVPTRRQFIAYPIQQADVESIQSLLAELYPDAKVVADVKSDQLLVWAEQELQQQIETAVEQMDVEPSARNQNKMAYYRLGELDARDVLKMFQSLTPDMTIQSDRRTNSLIAWGNEKDHQTLANVVEQFRTQGEAGERSVAVYQCGSRDPLDVRSLLVQLVPDATVVHDRNTGVVMAWASAADHAEIAKVVDKVKGRERSGATVKAYATVDMDADAVIALLTDLVPDARLFDAAADTKVVALATDAEHATISSLIREMSAKDPNQPAKQLQTYSVAVGGVSNQIDNILDAAIPNAAIAFSDDESTVTVFGSAEEQKIAAAAIESATSVKNNSGSRGGVVKSYATPQVDADYVTSLLSELFPTAHFFDAARDTQVVAFANADDHIRIEQIVREMNAKEKNQDGLQFRALQIRPEISSQIENILSDAIPNAMFAFSDDQRTVSVWADAADQKLASEMVASALKVKEEADAVLDDRETKTYRLKHAVPTSAIPPLASLFPDATFASDGETSSLIVTATSDQHDTINNVVSDLDVPPAILKETEIYQFAQADPSTAVTPLAQLLPNATFAVDTQTNSLIATASADQHEQIKEVIARLDVPPTNKLTTKVHPLAKSTPAAALAALTRLLPNATLAIDDESNSLIATATENDQARIANVIKALDSTQPTLRETRVYQLQTADPTAAQRALTSLLPNATFAVDGPSGSLIVTASTTDHGTIESTLRQFDKPTNRSASIQAYVLKRSDANSVFQTLSQVYRDHPVVRLSLDLPNRSIIAKAPPADQQTIAAIVARMETTIGASETLALEVYPLNTFDATNTISGLEALFRNVPSKPEFKFDVFSSQMFVVATPEQHTLIGKSLERLSGEPTDVEVFQLRTVDSFTVEQAIDQLYIDSATGPVVSSDPDTQQLIVRGTPTEIDAIRQLLNKMGEIGLGNDHSNSGSRIIPFRGNVDSAIQQLERVWPQLRANQLNILKSNEIEVLDNESKVEDVETTPRKPNGQPESDAGASIDSDGVTREVSKTADRDVDGGEGDLPPVFIVPGPSSITVSSEDPEALRQAESLLRAIAQQVGNGSSAGNFAVFRLRNAGARSVSQLLTKLFEQMPETTRGSLGRVSLVADDRMNAIVVHGRPADRSVLGQLLNVLDTDNADDSLANAVPEIVAVKNTNAERILEILQTVYQSQLERGGQTEEVEIPEGIDSEVASVLRQINAATAGPLLTLEVDSVTNSIIVLAPKLLGEQVARVIGRLDAAAKTDDTRSVQIIPLTGVKSEILQDAIEQLINK